MENVMVPNQAGNQPTNPTIVVWCGDIYTYSTDCWLGWNEVYAEQEAVTAVVAVAKAMAYISYS